MNGLELLDGLPVAVIYRNPHIFVSIREHSWFEMPFKVVELVRRVRGIG